MRRLLVMVAALAFATACGGGTAKGPAWPAPSTTAEDGGESLAPRETSIAVVEKSEDKADDTGEEKAKPAAAKVEPTEAAKPDEAKPDEETPSQPTEEDEVIISDEIVIEIEE